MELDYDFLIDNSIKLAVSLVLGALMGAEREYKGRNIGFRTIILITLGSTLFTIISILMGGKGDETRIASNIVTGVGFLGAGAIFREGFSVRGATTASLIWISAAVGMACGIGHYEFAVIVTIIVLVVLTSFTGVQKFIDKRNKQQIYKISFVSDHGIKKVLETKLQSLQLKFSVLKYQKNSNELTVQYEVHGPADSHEEFLQHLASQPNIQAFSV